MYKVSVNGSLQKLLYYVEREGYKGYDPYDTLNSPLNLKMLGKWVSAIAIQIQKRNPINIRPLLGIKKNYNPKGMGLFLKAYCALYKKTKDEKYLLKAAWIFNWLNENYTMGFSGKCWGYNFDWANPNGYLPAYTPSVVVTSFVVDGIYDYFTITENVDAKHTIVSAANYILKDIPITELPEGISFAYTHLSKSCCYNASLLAAEILAKADAVNKSNEHTELIKKAVDFVLSKQKPDGEWWYSYNPTNSTEKNQIDFHQGFILVSLDNIFCMSLNTDKKIEQSIAKGLEHYRNKQFYPDGISLWRLPKKWPVEIHNQSQGIITFTKLKKYNTEYANFAKIIAQWTIKNMQSEKGYFYYRKAPLFMNKIPYMRWAQAWMLLALTEIIENE